VHLNSKGAEPSPKGKAASGPTIDGLQKFACGLVLARSGRLGLGDDILQTL